MAELQPDSKDSQALGVEVVYFGCWRQVGHGLYDRNGKNLGLWHPVGDDLDGGFVPYKARGGGEGIVRLTVRDGYTILAFRDSSVDSRDGSHSTFVLTGTYGYGEALAVCKEAFPVVFARLAARGVELRPE